MKNFMFQKVMLEVLQIRNYKLLEFVATQRCYHSQSVAASQELNFCLLNDLTKSTSLSATLGWVFFLIPGILKRFC